MKLLTLEQVAERLNVNKSYVYRLSSEGRLPKVKLGPRTVRVLEDQLLEWIENKTKKEMS